MVQPAGLRGADWLILATAILASGLTFFAASTLGIALPMLQTDLGATLADIQWITNAYSIALAALMLVGGSVGDILGWRKMFVWGVLIFTAASVAAALSQTIPLLIGARVVQGLGAAFTTAGSLAIINVCIPKERRGTAIGLWAGLSGAIAALAPFLAGLLVEAFGWPSVFWVCLPLGLIVAAVAWRTVPTTVGANARPIDWLGAGSIASALGAASYALIQGPGRGWQEADVVGAIVVAAAAFGLFWYAERRSAHPLVPFGLFRLPLVVGANVATVLLYFSLNGLFFFLGLALQQIYGYSPSQAGLATLPAIVLISLLSGYGGKLADRYGPRWAMIGSPLAVGVAILLLTNAPLESTYLWHFFPGLVLFGLGMAAVIAPLTKSALSVPEEYSGVASGVNNLMSRVSNLLAVAILGAVMTGIFAPHLGESLAAYGASNETVAQVTQQSDRLGAIDITALPVDQQVLARTSITTAYLDGFQTIGIVTALLAFGSALSSFFLIRPKN